MAAPVLPLLLRDGDRLSRQEFLRRWEQLPELKHAELLDGTVYMASPVSYNHGVFHAFLTTWLGVYATHHPDLEPMSDPTALLGKDAPQPDIALRVLPEAGGRSSLEGLYLSGAPELIVEVAASSRARDLGPKLRLYLESGVGEYLTALVDEERLIWRQQRDNAWHEIAPDPDGILRSPRFSGLWLDAAALWRRDMPRVLAVLHDGLSSR